MTARLKLSLQAGTTASSSPLTAWNGLLRGKKKPGGALGNWTLTGPLAKTVSGVAPRVPGAAQDKEVVDRVMDLVNQADAVKPVPAGLIGQLRAVQSNVAVVGRDVRGNLTFGAPPAGGD